MENKRTLLVLGNGFDIAQGYNTRYSDFVKSSYFRNLVTAANGFAVYLNDKNVQSDKWVNLEKELENFSISLTNNNVYDNNKFRVDYKALCKNLVYFINEQLSKSTSPNLSIYDRVLQWKKNNPNLDIINFNYTHNIDMIFNEQNIRKYHVHGQTSTGIVLGVDENSINKLKEGHTFLIKSRQKGYQVREMQSVIANATKIIVFGCSLGDTDYWYYNRIFSQQNNTEYEIYYHGDDELVNIKDQIHHIYGSCSDFESFHQVEYIDSSKSFDLYNLYGLKK